MQKTKDVPVRGRTVRLGLIDAADGSWILGRIQTKLRDARAARAEQPSPQQRAPEALSSQAPGVAAAAVDPAKLRDEAMNSMAAFLIEQSTRTEIRELMDCMLAKCAVMEEMAGTAIAVPFRDVEGRWLPKLIEESDGPTILEVVKAAIAYNVLPYFTAPGSTESDSNSGASSQPAS